MGNFDDKSEEHGVMMSQPLAVAPGSSGAAVPASNETRREEANPSPNSGIVTPKHPRALKKINKSRV